MGRGTVRGLSGDARHATQDLLHVLTHPDVIEFTEDYVRSKR